MHDRVCGTAEGDGGDKDLGALRQSQSAQRKLDGGRTGADTDAVLRPDGRGQLGFKLGCLWTGRHPPGAKDTNGRFHRFVTDLGVGKVDAASEVSCGTGGHGSSPEVVDAATGHRRRRLRRDGAIEMTPSSGQPVVSTRSAMTKSSLRRTNFGAATSMPTRYSPPLRMESVSSSLGRTLMTVAGVLSCPPLLPRPPAKSVVVVASRALVEPVTAGLLPIPTPRMLASSRPSGKISSATGRPASRLSRSLAKR